MLLSPEDDETLKAAAADAQSVDATGTGVKKVTHGVSFRDAVTHVDDRGYVVEMFDLRWNWHPDPLVFAYAFTLRPGMVKGWGLHKLHEDRYFILQGNMEIVLYDIRPDSPTYRQVSKVVLSESRRRLMSVPKFVWHANHNIGDNDVLVANFPTLAYDHAKPDKYRLPLDTELIPFSFAGAKGW